MIGSMNTLMSFPILKRHNRRRLADTNSIAFWTNFSFVPSTLRLFIAHDSTARRNFQRLVGTY
jgi:hypothetical protein